MPRMTAIYKSALERAGKIGLSRENPKHEKLYDFLESNNYFWNADDKVWEEGQEPDDATPFILFVYGQILTK